MFHETWRMETMFKKTLLATAIASTTFAFNAAAVPMVAFTAKTVGQEGFAVATTAAKTADIGASIQVNPTVASYSVGDTVTFKLEGGAQWDTAAATTYYLDDAATGNATACSANCIVFSQLNKTATDLTFRVVNVIGTPADVNYYLASADGALKVKHVTTAATSLTSAAATSTGIAIDSSTTDKITLLSPADEVKVTITKGNAKVDVAADKKKFEDITKSYVTLNYAYTNPDLFDFTATKAKIDLAGDFSNIKEILCFEDAGTTACSTAKFTIAEDKKSATVTATNFAAATKATASIRYVLETEAAKIKEIVAPQDIKLTFTSENGAAAKAVAQDNAVSGSWTLNGSTVTIPYVPFGDNTQVITRLTNTGVKSGALSGRYMVEGVDSAWKDLGTLGTVAPGVTNIADLIVNAVKAKSGKTSGKFAVELTTNVPAGDVSVFAAYKVKSEQDRGFIGTYGAKAAGTQGN